MEHVSVLNEEYQRNAWDEMKNTINNKISEISLDNIQHVAKKLFLTNIYRGRGVLIKTVIEAQENCVQSTPVYATLFASVNMVFPIIGDLLLRRLIRRYQQGQQKNSLELKSPPAIFISFLLHQHVADECLVRQILIDLLTNPTNGSIQLAVSILLICSTKLDTKHREILLAILLEYRMSHQFDKQTNCMVDGFLATRDIYNQVGSKKVDEIGKKFQVIHAFELFHHLDPENYLDEFVYDSNYKVTENHYSERIKIIFDRKIYIIAIDTFIGVQYEETCSPTQTIRIPIVRKIIYAAMK
ncbi:hypothetical protein KQX54_006590 [Cotesia glomerata]|uniref:Uncharacterized protein n=1 Tax=Cotesia glomerata TaxID=32391 RepID=A0AAV7HV95_COTGL|nr:hypothetical protein KQX54_006590 [Cotesia glomerata]